MNEKNISQNSSFSSIPEMPKEENKLKVKSYNDTLDEIISNNSNTKIITFILSNEEIYNIDIKIAIKGYPEILSYIDLENQELHLPNWINLKMINDYFSYVKLLISSNYEETEEIRNCKYEINDLLNLANYFKNNIILQKIVDYNIINFIYNSNCILIMNHVLEYIENTKKDENINEIWVNLFKIIKNYIIEHFIELISDENNIKELNKIKCEEILITFLYKNYIMCDDLPDNIEINKLINIIGFLRDVNIDIKNIDKGDLIKIIKNEYQKSINEKINESNDDLTFSIDLLNFMKLFKDENEKKISQTNSLTFQNQSIKITIIYEKDKDLLNVKANIDNKRRIISLSSYAEFENNKEINFSNYCSLTFNQEMILAKLTGFSKMIQTNKENKLNSCLLSIKLRINPIQTFMTNYLSYSFSKIYKSHDLYKLPSTIFISILIYNQDKLKDEQKLISAMNWCK